MMQNHYCRSKEQARQSQTAGFYFAKKRYPQKYHSKNMSEIFYFRHKIVHTEKQNQKTRKVTYDKYALFD